MDPALKPYRNKCMSCSKIVCRANNLKFKCASCKDPRQSPSGWKRMREFIYRRDGEKCTVCSVTEEEYKKKTKKSLHVHHKDKNRRNNKYENLVLMCGQCHQSQHQNNFKQPKKIVHGQFGTRLYYRKDDWVEKEQKKQPRYFYGT